MWMACYLCVLLCELVILLSNFYLLLHACVCLCDVMCMKASMGILFLSLFEQTTDASPSCKPQPQQHYPGNATNDECANTAYANDDDVHPEPKQQQQQHHSRDTVDVDGTSSTDADDDTVPAKSESEQQQQKQ